MLNNENLLSNDKNEEEVLNVQSASEKSQPDLQGEEVPENTEELVALLESKIGRAHV